MGGSDLIVTFALRVILSDLILPGVPKMSNKTRIACAEACSQPSCKSFFHNQNQQICHLSDTIINNSIQLVPMKGVKYYSKTSPLEEMTSNSHMQSGFDDIMGGMTNGHTFPSPLKIGQQLNNISIKTLRQREGELNTSTGVPTTVPTSIRQGHVGGKTRVGTEVKEQNTQLLTNQQIADKINSLKSNENIMISDKTDTSKIPHWRKAQLNRQRNRKKAQTERKKLRSEKLGKTTKKCLQNGYVYKSEYGEFCYKEAMHRKETWFGARDACAHDNGTLLMANTERKHKLATDVGKKWKYADMWIGGHQVASRFVWLNQEPMSDKYWRTTGKDKFSNMFLPHVCVQYCMCDGMYSFDDLSCTLGGKGFICESPVAY